MNEDPETIRFTVDLPRDLVDLIDAHRDELANRAEEATGARLKVNRNVAIANLIRAGLKLGRSPKF